MNDIDWNQVLSIAGQLMLTGGLAGLVADIVNYFDPNKLERPLSTYIHETE